MDIERAIIASVIKDKSLAEAIDNGVTITLFDTGFHLTWRWMLKHFREFGESPGIQAFRQAEPEFVLPEVTEGVLYYASELRKKYIAVTAQKHMKIAAGMLRDGKDPNKIIEELRTAVFKADDIVHSSRDIDWSMTQAERLERYHTIQKSEDGVDGWRFPFPTLDKVTKGKHGGDLIVVLAYQGVGKSWFLTLGAKKDHQAGAIPGLFSKEMPGWQFGRRLDSLEYKLPYPELRDGKLDTVAYQRWIAGIEAIGAAKDRPLPFPIIDEETGGVSHIAAKAFKYKMDVIYIDGAYLMDDDRGAYSGWERFGNVTKDLKKLAKKLDIPIVISVQANEDGDVAYFKGIKQDADIIIQMSRTEDQELTRIMQFDILKVREGAKLHEPLEVLWDIDNVNFEEFAAREQVRPPPKDRDVEY